MRLRARKPGPSVACGLVTSELVRAMAYRMYGALIGSLGVVALMLVPNETFARSGAAHAGGLASTRSISHAPSHPPLIQSFRHHRRNHARTFFPAVGGFFDAPSNGEPMVDVPQAASGDMHYTYTYDVPWDWAHRYPPAVTPSERPYVSSCPTEAVTVPGRGGSVQTVNVMRCY